MKFRLSLVTLVGTIFLVAFVEAQNRGSNSATGSHEKIFTYAQSWESDLKQPESMRFRDWTSRYFASGAADAKAKASLIAEGRQLARQRRAAFAKLIKSDPAEALASTVPAAMRKKLPAEILPELETRVSGIGDFLPMALDRARGGPPVEPIQRFVRLNNRTYRAYVYGRRIWQTTKHGIPLHGVLLNGILALAESSLRELEPEEASEMKQGIVDLASRDPAVNAASVLADVGGTTYRFASRQQLFEAETKLEAAEAGIGPKPKESATKILELGANAFAPRTTAEPNSWTIGNKHWLIIRVDFSDLPGDPTAPGGYGPYTAAEVQTRADTLISPFYASTSYGLTSLTNTATTQLYRMPHTAEYYATTDGGIVQCIMDAETAASANYTIGNYERIALLTSYLGNIPGSQITYGGGSAIGGPDLHANGFFDFRVPAHELGHTYGLYHANLWQVNDSNPVSPNGIDAEYGDDYDVMGNAYDGRGEFNPWFKNVLGWIADNQVQTVTSDDVYRVYRFDTSTPAAGPLALKISRSGNRDYWISCRRNYTDNPSMQNGAYIIWGYNFNRQSDLLDMVTPGNRPVPCLTPMCDPAVALAVGSTLTDPDEGISIKVLGKGGSGSAQYIDVAVTIRSTTIVGAPLNSDPGWTRQGEWAFGVPAGQGGAVWGHPDPTSGATGANVFGTDLNGDWSGTPGVFYYLTAGPFNLTGYTHSKLRFARWLNTDYQACAYVTIDVSSDGSTWTTVWNNDSIGEITDSSWTQVIYDISAVADNKPAVFVRWGYQVNCAEQYPYSGWNIDDIEFIAVPAGSLKVNISPADAISAGAQWKVDGGAFQNSGTTLTNLSIGSHTVSFKAVSGWTRPADQIVAINANQITTTTGTYVQVQNPVDFNGDNKPDFLLYNSSTRRTALWYLNNNILSGSAYGPTLASGYVVAGVADFNNDGSSDYALFNPTTRRTAIWYLSGATLMGSAYGPTSPSGYQLIAVADFNGDGKPDFLLQNSSTRRTALWYLNNNILTGSAYGPTLASGYVLGGVADFNGDGDFDYALFNPTTRKTAIWYLSGAALVSSAYGPTLASGYQLVGAADFDRDGKPDFLLYNAATRRTAIWYLNNNVYTGGAYGPTLASGYTLAAP